MNELAVEFWKRTNKLIKDKNSKQENVAQECGIPYQTLRSWVTRQTFPDALQTYKIAQALNTTVEYLVTGEDSTHGEKIAEIKNLLLLVNQNLDILNKEVQ